MTIELEKKMSKFKKQISNQAGQVILTIILIMSVVLAVGLSVIQKSLSDVTTATKVEQSQRAFSAAEAGIEKTLKGGDQNCGDPNKTCVSFDNASQAKVTDTGFKPAIASPGTRQEPVEFDALFREQIAQVWLADYTSNNNPPTAQYAQPTLDVYWGNPTSTDKTAIELTLIYFDGSQYTWRKWYLDHPILRAQPNGFCQISTCGGGNVAGSKTYQCKFTLGDPSSSCINGVAMDNSSLVPNGSTNLMVIRARLLYNDNSQPLAFWAVGTCGAASCSLPRQKREIYSLGSSGDTQRRVKVSQWNNVVPFYFDYAIFSAGEINK